MLNASLAPDLILHNGHVLTMDAGATRARAVAAKNGRIVAVGANDILEHAGKNTRVIDL